MKSLFLVSIQFAAIIYLFLTARLVLSLSSLLLITSGISIGIWAILTMRHSRLNITPNVLPSATLVTTGPYHFIRHPMYFAILLTCLGLLLPHLLLTRTIIYLILTADLIAKISYEESLLVNHFPAYSHYQQHTSRLIPWLW